MTIQAGSIVPLGELKYFSRFHQPILAAFHQPIAFKRPLHRRGV